MGIRQPQEEGMAFKKYIFQIKRARRESMTSWINRSDEAFDRHEKVIGITTWCKIFTINDDPSTKIKGGYFFTERDYEIRTLLES